jgi:hypothetical protein
MPLFGPGDRVRYVGENLERREAYIKDIKVFCSEAYGRPIYNVVWDGEVEVYIHGIMEHNLKLIKRRLPDWEV